MGSLSGHRVRLQGLGGSFPCLDPRRLRGAPTPVTAFLAAAIKGAAFAAFIRIFVVALGELHGTGSRSSGPRRLTMIVPNLIALVQDNIKRLLAYSSIAHAGYLLVALISANESGMAAFCSTWWPTP